MPSWSRRPHRSSEQYEHRTTTGRTNLSAARLHNVPTTGNLKPSGKNTEREAVRKDCTRMKKAKTTKLTKRIAVVAAKTKKLAAKVQPKPAAKPVSIVKTLTDRGARIKITAKNLAPKAVKPIVVRESIAKKPGSNKSAASAVTTELDAPHIECRLIVGDLSVQVDPNNFHGLDHTIGAGMYGHGKGLIDTWPEAVWTGLLVYLGLPADPLDLEAAEKPVKRLVQRLWYEAMQGGVPEERKAVFDARDAGAAGEYKAGFSGVKQAAAGRTERAKKAFGRKGETIYTPTDALKDKSLELGGQQSPLLEFFRVSKFAPATAKQATDGTVAQGLKTGTKPERIVSFYLSTWCKRGLLTRA